MKQDIAVFLLSNGIRVVSHRRDTEAAAFVFMVGSGSRYEPDAVVGVSHALEHMMFKGTAKRSAYDIAAGFDEVGADINASTEFEYTTYHFVCPIQFFPQALEIYADMLNHSCLSASEWDKERGAVLEEKKRNDEENSTAVQILLLEKMFNLQMGVIGSEETISHIRVSHMREMIRKYYLPENITLSVSGSMEHGETFALLEKYFGAFHKSWDVTDAGLIAPPVLRSGLRYAESVRQMEQTCLVLEFPAYSRSDPRRFALALMSEILGGDGMSSRLFSEVREKRGLVYFVQSDCELMNDAGLFLIVYQSTRPIPAFAVIIDELSKMRLKIHEKELASVKRQLKAAVQLNESSLVFAKRNAKNMLFYDKTISNEELYREIDAVSLDEVLRVAQDVLDMSKVSVAAVSGASLKNDIEKFFL